MNPSGRPPTGAASLELANLRAAVRVNEHFPWATLPHVGLEEATLLLVEVKFASEARVEAVDLPRRPPRTRASARGLGCQEGGIGSCSTGGHVSSATTDPCATSSDGTKGGGASKTGSPSSADQAKAISRAAAGGAFEKPVLTEGIVIVGAD